MKTVFLLRHGHAETKDVIPDSVRNIDLTGRKEAEEVAQKLFESAIRPDHFVSSHANRAFQTAEIVADALGYPVKNIQIERRLYYTGEDRYLDVINEQDDKFSSVMFAGHNPYISRIGRDLAEDFDEHLPTAGVLCLQFDVNSWRDVAYGKGKLKFFLYPSTAFAEE